MNWTDALSSLEVALEQTAEITGIERLSQSFGSIADGVTHHCGSAAGLNSWTNSLAMIRQCFERTFSGFAGPDSIRGICEDFDSLVLKCDKKAYELCGGRWSDVRPLWKKVKFLAQDLARQSRGNKPSLQDLFLLTRDEHLNLVRYLRDYCRKHRHDYSDELLVAKRMLSEECFKIRLCSLLNSSGQERLRSCARASERARHKRKGISPIVEAELNFQDDCHLSPVSPARAQKGEFRPTLTASSPCVLDPSQARELLAGLKTDPRAVGEGIPEILALWFGAETVELFEFWIKEASDPLVKARCLDALGTVGGYEACRVLCGLLWDPSVNSQALDILVKLASDPVGHMDFDIQAIPSVSPGGLSKTVISVGNCDEDQKAKHIVTLLLGNIIQLKKAKILARHRLDALEQKILEYRGPAPDAED